MADEPKPLLTAKAQFRATPAGVYEFSDSQKKALLSDLKSEHEEMRRYQYEPRRRWTKLELYLAGRQVKDGINGNYVGHEIAGAPSETGEVDDEFFIVNEFRRIHMQNMQRLTAYTLQANVVPNSKDPDDKKAARLGRMVLNTIFSEIGEKKLKRKIARILGLYGLCFFKTYYDPSAGRIIAPLKFDEHGKTYYDQNDLRPEGRVIISVVSPRNILLPALNSDIKKADQVEELGIETCDYIWRRYRLNVAPENITFDKYDGPAWSSSMGDQSEIERLAPKNSVLVRTRWILPCPRFQRGAILTYCDNHLLESATLMDHYNGDEQPWDVAECMYDDRTPMADSMLWDDIPLQDAENQVVTGMVNHIKMYGDGQMTIPASSGLDSDKISNKSGKHIVFNGEKKPEPIEWPELSQTHFKVFEGLRTMMQSLSSAHDIERVDKAQSGNAISNLQEIDDNIVKLALDSVEGALTNQSKIALALVEEKYTTNRLLKMTGMAGWQINDAFRGEMLKGNWHAVISLMNGMPSNIYARREYIESLIKIPPSPDGSVVMSAAEARVYLELGNVDDALEDMQKENEIADTILSGIVDFPNNYMDSEAPGAGGMMLPTKLCKTIYHMFDNHELLVKKLLTYMRENYDHEPKEVQQTLTDFLQFHQGFLAAAMTPGAPGAGPHPAMMAPPVGGGPIQPPPPGPSVPRGTPPGPGPGHDSVHSTAEQPPRSPMMPTNTGHQSV